MKPVKYYGTITVLSIEFTFTFVLMLLYFFLDIWSGSIFFLLWTCPPFSIITVFIVSKILKKFRIGAIMLEVKDGAITVPNKFYWSKDKETSIAIKDIICIRKNVPRAYTFNFLKMTVIEGKNTKCDTVTVNLDHLYFESNKDCVNLTDYLISKADLKLVGEDSLFYMSSLDTYSV